MATGDTISESLFVAAIDFGTTFSGYAFSNRNDYKDDPSKVAGCHWSVGSQPGLSLKTPSCILFDPEQNFDSFGGEAEDKYTELAQEEEHGDWYFFRRFKMQLYGKEEISRDFMLEGENGLQMPAIKVFAEGIKFLRTHFEDHINIKADGIKPSDVEWVLTVPAIWPDPTKKFMKEAANAGGIPNSRLILALEPEAASIYCKNLPVDRTLSSGGRSTLDAFASGTQYLILDAGETMPLMRKRGRPSTFYTFENGRSRKQTKIIKVEDTKLHVPPIPDVIEEQKIETEPEPTSSTSTDIEEVSGYTKAKTQRLENWGGIYKKLVAVGLEQNAVTELTCNDCGINTIDLFRCIDCISTPVLCFDCLEERHKHPHLHIFEKWMHGTFFGYSPPTAPWKIKIHADCERSYLKELVIVDEKGRQHLRTVQFCTCEEEAETLLRFNLWASSPKHPRLAFHIDLLRWLNGLLLECKVSAQGFCEALKARQPKLYKELVPQEGKQIYKTLINETIHQFRQYIYQMDYCTDLFPDLDDGCSCPACFEADKNIYCFDADFQLVRKSSSGQHWISPKHKDHFFIEQQLVDDFISSYGSLKVDKECSDFQAGNDIRSKSKNQKLSETAVFGATCRHDFPQKFFSLKHGERLGYAVFLIQLLLKENKNDKIHVSYDIACMLKRHIEKAGNKEISQNVTFSIPIFHCYGHSASCQIIYGPRRTEGIGLTDGEGIERLWSCLGGFSNISKEMSPENRCDLLTDALIHYGRKIRDKQGEVLVMKIKRTIQLMETTKVALREILATVPESEIKEDTVMEWIEEEKRAVLSPNISDSTLHLSKADEYVINLQRFFKISGHQSNEETSEEDKRLEKQLMIFEKKHHSIRPTPTSDQFTSDLILAKEKERKLNLNAIRSHMSERQYLLRLMRKYAKGQSVFARLSKQLKGVSKKIQKSITLYNNVGMSSGELPVHVLFDTVKDLDSEVYKTLQLNNAVDTVISSTTKQEIIQSKCLLDRCHEEMNLLKIEMLSVINWNKTLYSKIKLQINSSVTPGSTALLLREGMSLELAMCKLNTLFKEYIGEVLTETTLTEGVLTDDFEKMQQMLMYLASVEELPIEEIDSDIEDSDEDEDSLEL